MTKQDAAFKIDKLLKAKSKSPVKGKPIEINTEWHEPEDNGDVWDPEGEFL